MGGAQDESARGSYSLLAGAIAVAAGLLLSTPAEAAASMPLFASRDVEEVRSLPAADLGITRLAGLAFSWRDDSLLVADARRGHTRVMRLSLLERRRGSMRLPRLSRPSTISVDRASGRLTAVGREAAVTVAAVRRGGRRLPVQRADVTRLGLRDPRGATFDRAGETLYILDAGANEIVKARVRAGSLDLKARISLDRLGERPRGIAFNPDDRRLYVLSADPRRIFALDAAGDVVGTHDLGSLILRDPKAMVFAPSADPTDDPASLHLYIADGGGAPSRGRIVEADLVPRLALAAAAAELAPVSLVQMIDTSTFNPPSPDPSGIVYVPDSDRFIMSDSEVDEMSIYRGANLFAVSRLGGGAGIATTVPFSREPTGLGYKADDQTLFISDDDADGIYIVRPGADGAYGTADDVRSFLSSLSFDSTDAESVEYDAVTGHLFICDGTGREIYRVDPVNGAFGDGDDLFLHFDIEVHGARDCEGMGIDPQRRTLLAVDPSTRNVYELTKTGALVRVLDLSSIPVPHKAPSSITMAPTSNLLDSRSRLNYWITDRQVDNGTDPNENDGKIYEVSASRSTAPIPSDEPAPSDWAPADAPPSVTLTAPSPGSTLSGTVTVQASASDDKGVARVSFAAGGTVIGADANGADGWSLRWASTRAPDGVHEITATATDTARQSTTSPPYAVTVHNPGTPPATPGTPAGPGPQPPPSCVASVHERRLVFSAARYPNIRAHVRAAIRKGWPRRLVLHRRGASARGARLMKAYPQRAGYGRDQYPPTVGRGRGKGLERGRDPRGWRAHVRYVPNVEYRSFLANRGAKLSRLCDGTAFRYVFR